MMNLSKFGFGGLQLGGYGIGKIAEKEVIYAAHKAIELGINWFDTAPIYGLGYSEEVLAKIIQGKRNQVKICTKTGLLWSTYETFHKWVDNSKNVIYRQVNESLKRLNTDYIDIYLLHFPDNRTPVKQTMFALSNLRKHGKINAMGCCNIKHEDIQHYQGLDYIQMPYNLIQRGVESDIIPYCQENDIKILTYSSLAEGYLSGQFNNTSEFEDNDRRNKADNRYFGETYLRGNEVILNKVKHIARKYKRTPSQIALNWLLQKDIESIILGVINDSELEENLQALDFKIKEEDMEFLNEKSIEKVCA